MKYKERTNINKARIISWVFYINFVICSFCLFRKYNCAKKLTKDCQKIIKQKMVKNN